MSNPVRVAFVMEGPTDYVVLRAAVRALLAGRDFEPTNIWPELDENLRPKTEGGWGGVYKWCRQVLDQAGGTARENPVFALNDMVVIQVDADMARMKYQDYGITDAPNDELRRGTCEKKCPPPGATTDSVRTVILGWLGEAAPPPHTVLCTPSKNLETWVLVGLFPKNEQVIKPNPECRWGLEVQLRKYGLMKGKKKLIDKYEDSEKQLQAAWPDIRGKCSEAERFSVDFLALVPVQLMVRKLH
jgi:hypothetical protein